MTTFYFLILFLCSVSFGAVIGAYFGTADYRIRNDLPLVTSGCYCPACRHELAMSDQVPVLSWFFLGGKCRYCQKPIPFRYPLIEGGFLFYYGITFLLLWKHPFRLLLSWTGLLCLALFFRCQGHYCSLLKGFSIFAGYHILYGTVLIAIYASLGML